MVGQGVLRECVLDSAVAKVLVIGRTSTGVSHPKVREIVRADLARLDDIAELRQLDACFYCLGVTSVVMNEADYTRITCELTMSVARTLVRTSPQMTFIFVSGAGADSSERGSIMWARVKGRAENGVLGLPFRGSYVFRPGAIQPLHGVRSRTRWYRALYLVFGPLMGFSRWLFPRSLEAADIYAASQ